MPDTAVLKTPKAMRLGRGPMREHPLVKAAWWLQAEIVSRRFGLPSSALAGSASYGLLCKAMRGEDRHFCVSHSGYIAKGLSMADRIDLATHHYLSEDKTWSTAFLSAVYGGPGIELYRRDVDGVSLSLCLQASARTPHEGAASVCLRVYDTRLCELAYICLPADAKASGATPQPTRLLVSRNQSARPVHPGMKLLSERLVVQSPKHLCMAALQGVAETLGATEVLGLRSELQIAYEAELASSFKASYDDLWLSLGGSPSSPFGYTMALPLHQSDLAQVPSKHRKRARLRRELCAEISASARAALAPYRRQVACAQS